MHVVVRGTTDINSESVGVKGSGGVRGVSSIFQRIVGCLQQQPLLRVHATSLARGYVEEGVVEGLDVGQEVAMTSVHRPARMLGILGIHRDIETLLRDLQHE